MTRVGGDVRWWTWAGYRANATLAATLPSVADPLQRPTDSWLRLREDLTPADWRAARDGVGDTLVLPDVDRRAVRGLKFSAALRSASPSPPWRPVWPTSPAPAPSLAKPCGSSMTADGAAAAPAGRSADHASVG